MQIVSVKWYLWGARGKLRNTANSDCDINGEKKTANWTLGCVLLLHTTQIGVLWRYFKLFIPVDLTYVKHEVSLHKSSIIFLAEILSLEIQSRQILFIRIFLLTIIL